MITDSKKWHYLVLKNERTFDGEKWHNRAVTSLSRLLSGITSNHHGDFYSLNCYHSYSTEDGLKKHEKVCNDHDYCHTEMSKGDKKNIKIQPWRKIIKSSIHNLY